MEGFGVEVRSTYQVTIRISRSHFRVPNGGATSNLPLGIILPNDSSHSRFQKEEKMSNHFTGLSLGPPLGDQRLDLCDLYAFQSPDGSGADRDHPQCESECRRAPSRRHLPPQHRQRRRLPDGHRVQLRVLAAAKRQADRKRLCGERRGIPLGRSGRDEDHRRRRGLLRPQTQHRQVRRLHVLRRQSQRRFLFRLRRNQESVRYQGRQEFHRAAPGRQVAVDRRGFEYAKPMCSRR